MKCKKHYTPADKGKVIIYLCDELINLKKEITVTVNGKQVFQGKIKPDLKNMANSCALSPTPDVSILPPLRWNCEPANKKNSKNP